MAKPLHIVILAAGEGTRMRSSLPKVLQPIGGRPMLSHLLDTARAIEPQAIHVVYGSSADAVREAFAGQQDIRWVLQAERLGTGHAVVQAMPDIPDEADVLVLYADHPLVPVEVLQDLLAKENSELTLLTLFLADPAGYGRILRDRTERVTGIVEQKDATAQQLTIKEVNTGIVRARARRLRGWLEQLGNDNAQGEYYLTDIFAMAHDDGVPIETVQAPESQDLQGANDRIQLAMLERRYQLRAGRRLMAAGAQLADPARVEIRGQVAVGRDVKIDINAVFIGDVELEDGVEIGPGCVLQNCRIGSGSRIKAYCVIEDAVIGGDCDVGPYARLRPGTRLADSVRVGNFVETKNIRMGGGSKASHLSYLGDAEIGAEVNIGAGTITCNYDGANKHRTVIEDGAFIGSDTQLVAPVTVGRDATVGAGSTITKDVPAEHLAVSRPRQTAIKGWRRPVKSKGSTDNPAKPDNPDNPTKPENKD